jgi:uncharacterized protein YbjT (DUF2867 family)
VRVLVTGASGNVGRAVLESLRALGVEAVAAQGLDFTDPSTWDQALQGVDRLFLLRPPAISQVRSTLNAFVDRGRRQLEHVVFLSVVGAQQSSIIPHARVEAHLAASGLPWTFLRAGFFAQNLLGSYRLDLQRDDRLYVPAGGGRVAWVDTRDLGEAAARAFVDPAARQAAWTLTGPESATFAQVARVLSEELGREIRYEPASLLGYLWHLRRRRGLAWGEALVHGLLHVSLRFEGQAAVDPTLERVLGRRPRTVRDTIRDHRELLASAQ